MDWIEARRNMSRAAKYDSEIEGVNTTSPICRPNDHYEKTKEAEYQKGYQAGQQDTKKSQ